MRTESRGVHGGWQVHRVTGTAHDLHHMDPPEAGRHLLVMEVERPALVLGSSQDRSQVDVRLAGRRGVDVVSRRSGGGAVLLVPGDHRWVDLVIPAGDPLWEHDVARSMSWVGHAWAAAGFAARPDLGATVHEGPMVDRDLGATACFAGVGPGEVLVGSRKLVGVSQRRTRSRARMQTVVHHAVDVELTLALLAPVATPRLAAALRHRVAASAEVGLAAGWDDVERLVPHLPV